MKIRTHITVLRIVVIGAVLLTTGAAFTSHFYGNYYLKRVEASNHQLEAITSVAMHTNDFAEQIAELLLVGEGQRDDYDRAAKDLEAAFVHLEKTTRDEHHFLVDAGRPSDVRDELHRLARMRELYAQIDVVVQEIVELRKVGRFDDAVQLFLQDIENRLDAEFEHLLRAAVLQEQREVQLTEYVADQVWTRLAWIIVIVAVLTLVISLVTTHNLAKALLRPVQRLLAGTEAISQGDLSSRIDYQGDDELGMLAQGFNRMAEKLEHQRDQVRHAHADLEHQVTDRTRKLESANRRLSEQDRLRVQFFADISHELRTPLTALRGEAEITLRRPPESHEVYRDVLARIANLATDMARQVEDLLVIARNESDTLYFDIGDVCLQDVVAKVIDEGTALGRSKQISLETSVPSQIIWVRADAHRLTRALMIVVDNAIEYSPSGSAVCLHVSAGAEMAQIVVRDQGRGIHEEDLPHVFNRAWRAASGVGGGLGIGLSIARRLIEKQGGEIEISSEPGCYTEVRINIPGLTETHGDKGAVGRG